MLTRRCTAWRSASNRWEPTIKKDKGLKKKNVLVLCWHIIFYFFHLQVSSSEYFCVYFDGENGFREKEEFIPAIKGVSLA